MKKNAAESVAAQRAEAARARDEQILAKLKAPRPVIDRPTELVWSGIPTDVKPMRRRSPNAGTGFARF